jgi:hypothetical protein
VLVCSPWIWARPSVCAVVLVVGKVQCCLKIELLNEQRQELVLVKCDAVLSTRAGFVFAGRRAEGAGRGGSQGPNLRRWKRLAVFHAEDATIRCTEKFIPNSEVLDGFFVDVAVEANWSPIRGLGGR